MLPTGLQRHPKSGSYYLRRRIPSDLLDCYPGKTEVVFSLKTKDYRAACAKHRVEEARLTLEWTQKRQQREEALKLAGRDQSTIRIHALTSDAIEDICLHAEALKLALDDARRESETPYTLEELQQHRMSCHESNEQLKRAVAIGDHEVLRRELQSFLDANDFDVKATDAEMRRLALALGRTSIRTNEKLINRCEGKFEPTPVLARQLATPMLSEVTRAYVEYYEALDKREMLYKVEAVMSLLIDITGDKPIGSLKQSDLVSFFNTVQNLPPQWKAIARRTGMSAREGSG